MRRLWLLLLVTFVAVVSASPASHPRSPARPAHTFTTNDTDFLLDGKPFQIIAGEMHYPRVPRAYWRDRMKKARAMGLNTISTYVFWNLHEPRPGVFDFSDNLDVAAYIRIAQEEGLYVILRPGPYVCAEWDLGGIPSWLLSQNNIVLRSTDEQFMSAANRYLDRLGQELAPLQFTRGGPIIGVQVENEYGSFDRDKSYLAAIRDAIRHAGLGEVLLYTADGDSQLPDGTLPDLQAVVNFGPGSAESAFASLRQFRPRGPLMSGEYWAGWFDSWGRKHNKTDLAREAKELDWILSRGYSINFYMFHGGTTFGLMNGANGTRQGYAPQTTSYDYDAALDEAGRPTKKYFAFRDVIAHNLPSGSAPLPEPPANNPVISISEFELNEATSLWANLGRPVVADHPRSMETFGQSYGYILYRIRLTGPADAPLTVSDLHDYAQVYLDGQLVGVLDRRRNQDQICLTLPERSVTLDVLVENSGRINFRRELREERKGITKSVTLGERELTGWEVYTLPMDNVSALHFSSADAPGPAFYRGVFALEQAGDTFLDTRGWGKGVVWVNGHCLGRIWSVGPQQTLYVPGAWLQKGDNEVIVFDMENHDHRTLRGLDFPVLDQLMRLAATNGRP